MNLKPLLISFLLFQTVSLLHGQEITGKLTDKETSNPVEFTTVELLSLPDSISVEAVLSNTQGLFSLKKLEAEKSYCIRVKHLSYKPRIIPVVKRQGSNVISLGTIPMEPAVIGMKEVVVNGAKILVTELPDKTVYAVSEGIKKTSVDGIDVLRKIPSVQVDYLNEEIKVEGKSNIVIEVDGVTRSKDYLKKLHPKQIAKFEINNTPSGKYDPETDAVINIITDPSMRYGLKGMTVVQGIPNPDVYQAYVNANLDYGLEKISYYIGGFGVTSHFANTSNTFRETGSSILNRTGLSTSEADYMYLNTGLNYDPDKKNTLSYSLSYNRNTSDGTGSMYSRFSAGELSKWYRTISNSENNNDGLNTSLYYKHKFDKDGKHSIEVEASYYNSLNSNSKTSYQNIYLTEEEMVTYMDPRQNEENRTNSQSSNSRVSYILPFDSVYTFGTGLSVNYVFYDLENISSLTNAPNLDYKDFRGSAYIDFSRQFKNGFAKAGTRFETSDVTINSKDKSRYFSFLPYANAQYRFNKESSIRLGYTRRVIRPSSYDLNPFVSVIDSLTVRRGNIELKPAYRDNFQLNYSYRFAKGKYSCTLSPQVFYDYQTQIIKRIYKNIGNNRLENVPENISNGYQTGGGLSVNAQLSQVMINTYFRYIYYHVDSYKDQILATDRNGWNLNLQLMSPLFYKINFMSYAIFNSPSIDAQSEFRSRPMYYFGLRRQLWGSSSLMIMAINPFGAPLNKNTTIVKNEAMYQKTISQMNLKNAIIVTFSYNFKHGKDINIQKNSAPQEENRMPISF